MPPARCGRHSCVYHACDCGRIHLTSGPAGQRRHDDDYHGPYDNDDHSPRFQLLGRRKRVHPRPDGLDSDQQRSVVGCRPPANALDGNYSSRFSTGEEQRPGLYFEVNLGSAENFNELKMSMPESPSDYARGFDVYASNDASSWTRVAGCSGSATPEIVSFSPQTAKYVKVVLNTGADVWWSIDEFNLYNPTAQPTTTTTTTAPTTTTTTVPGSNCSAVESGFTLNRTGWTATSNAPSSGAYAPANALDGNYSSRFSTGEEQVPGLYFEVNLGSAENFNELKMSMPESPTDYARGFDVYASNDASSWTRVAGCSGSATPEIVSFSPQTAKYVKVVLNTGADVWWSIDEFNLYNPTAQPTTTTTTSTTTTTTTAPPTTTTTTVPPFKFHGQKCVRFWPHFLIRGSLITTRHAFFAVMSPMFGPARAGDTGARGLPR